MISTESLIYSVLKVCLGIILCVRLFQTFKPQCIFGQCSFISGQSVFMDNVRLFQVTVYSLDSVRLFQATVYLMDKLSVLLTKVSEEDTRSDILPMIFNALESNSIQGQVCIPIAHSGLIL